MLKDVKQAIRMFLSIQGFGREKSIRLLNEPYFSTAQTKFAASSMLPAPLYLATWG
jgi:hypothetical protein